MRSERCDIIHCDLFTVDTARRANVYGAGVFCVHCCRTSFVPRSGCYPTLRFHFCSTFCSTLVLRPMNARLFICADYYNERISLWVRGRKVLLRWWLLSRGNFCFMLIFVKVVFAVFLRCQRKDSRSFIHFKASKKRRHHFRGLLLNMKPASSGAFSKWAPVVDEALVISLHRTLWWEVRFFFSSHLWRVLRELFIFEKWASW